MKDQDRVEALGEVAWDVLQRMARDLLARKSGGHLVEHDLQQLDLSLPLALKGADADPQRFARRLAESIDQQLDDAVQHVAAFRPGHAFCHRCGGAVCEHSQPPSCRHVFVGYAPTGMPRWGDFGQLCLDRKHPEVDLLYETPPPLLTLIQDRNELHGGLLRAFDNGSYELLGQVTAGFFTVRARAEEGRGVLALSVQAALSRSKRGRMRIGLNLLGRAPSGEGLDSLWERHDDLPWRRPVRWAQAALQSLRPGRRARRSRSREPQGTKDGSSAGAGADPAAGTVATLPPEIERRVEGILNGLARRLGQDRRSRSRRTRHAEQRHASGERPTRKAIDDARTIRPEGFFVDERSGTLVVLGDRGRTHFFTPDGQLVSSVRYRRDAIARKIKLDLWRPGSEQELETFRKSLPD
jgi:hypothetical protein